MSDSEGSYSGKSDNDRSSASQDATDSSSSSSSESDDRDRSSSSEDDSENGRERPSRSTLFTTATHAAATPCDDRQFHGQRLNRRPPHVGPNCSGPASHPPHQHWLRQTCATVPSIFHGPVHWVCGQCDNDTQASGLVQETLRAIDPVTGVTPPLQPPSWPTIGPNAPVNWTGFLTRLCSNCEHQEQRNYHERIVGWATQGLTGQQPAGPPGYLQQLGWPRNSCTCAETINGRQGPFAGTGGAWVGNGLHQPRNCRRDHRLRVYMLIGRRKAADAWLRGIALDSNGTTCKASGRRLRSRLSRKESTYRACRCGAEVDTMKKAEVFMCLACEGLVFMRLPGPRPAAGTVPSWALPPATAPASRFDPNFRSFQLAHFSRASTYRRRMLPVNLFRPVANHTA